MSDLRRFGIGAFVLVGIFSAACNHGLIAPPGDHFLQTLSVMFFGGCAAVTIFGRRDA